MVVASRVASVGARVTVVVTLGFDDAAERGRVHGDPRSSAGAALLGAAGSGVGCGAGGSVVAQLATGPSSGRSLGRASGHRGATARTGWLLVDDGADRCRRDVRGRRSCQLLEQRMTRLDLGDDRVDAGSTGEVADVLGLLRHHYRDDDAIGTGAGGATRTVRERLVFGRRVDVHDEGDVVDMDAAGGDVGGDEDAGGALGEGTSRLRSRAFWDRLPCSLDGGDAGQAMSVLGELLGTVLGAHEQQRSDRHAAGRDSLIDGRACRQPTR